MFIKFALSLYTVIFRSLVDYYYSAEPFIICFPITYKISKIVVFIVDLLIRITLKSRLDVSLK